MIELNKITAFRWASGPAGSGVEVLVDGRWEVYSSGPYADDGADELRAAGIPEMPGYVYVS